MTRLFGVLSQSATKIVGIGVLIVLTGWLYIVFYMIIESKESILVLNFAGLRFIIRLQLLLLCFLAMAMLDFFFGTLTTIDKGV